MQKDKRLVLGVGVDLLTRYEVLEIITKRIDRRNLSKLFFVVTAYSEFFVTALRDGEFRKVLREADLVIPDGVGVLSAIRYGQILRDTDSGITKLAKGLMVGLETLAGRVGEPVSGIWLFANLCEIAAARDWRIFLLGGFGDVVYRVCDQLKEKYPTLKIVCEPGGQNPRDITISSDSVISKINQFKPDLLFVAYNPVRQEKWIAKYKRQLKVKVAVGVGGTFNEIISAVRPTPEKIGNIGLKWFWRFIVEPGRWRRTLNAFPVFPFLVFKESLTRKYS